MSSALPIRARLPLAAMTAADAGAQDSVYQGSVRWGRGVPVLPAELTASVLANWGLRIETGASDAQAAEPSGFPAFCAAVAQTRAEQTVRTLSARTNLVLAGSRILVVGDGLLADALQTMLSRIGARVTRTALDPAGRLRARLAGLPVVPPEPASWPDTDHILVTGEGHPPLDPAGLAAIVLDASLDARGLRPTAGPSPRQHVHRVGAARVVAVAPPIGAALADLSGTEWHLADLVVTLSLLVAARDPDPDARLAEAVLA